MLRTLSLATRLQAAFALAATLALIGSLAVAQTPAAAPAIPREDTAACLACHSESIGAHAAVDPRALEGSPHKDLKCQDCHSSMTSAPHTPEMLKTKAECATCHPTQSDAYKSSAHSQTDQVDGDHPTCVTCHGGGSPHAIKRPSAWSRKDKVALCSRCHQQRERMVRYNVDAQSVPSYLESFHGKALVRFGMDRVAICVNCHGYHDVLPPQDPRAPTHRDNAAKTCGQTGCHPGAQTHFAMSGANHLRLKLEESLPLRLILFFFRALLTMNCLMLVGAVGLDLRLKVLSRNRVPACGRPTALLICVGYLSVVAGFLLAAGMRDGAGWAFALAFASMVLAYVVYMLGPARKRNPATHAGDRRYPRLTKALRAQHILMFTCFTLLALSGIPLRFAQIPWMQTIYLAFGGPAVGRVIHRVAGLGLITAWVWHMGWLIARWKMYGWSFKSWTMLPCRKDLSDVWVVAKLYFGIGSEEPKYERFQFREKADYFAEYWGMPIMVATGFVLWFPVFWGNRLPEVGLSTALIAHGFEATLAFVAIVTWHMYNAHFNPDCFPGQRVWFEGTLTREEMERDHGLELERLDAAEKKKPGA